MEKLFWYVAYSFYDFWWHTLGADTESHILHFMKNLQSLIGPLFSVYLLGWVVIVSILTGIIIYGFYYSFNSRSKIDILFLVWIGLFLLIYAYRNIGWSGAFQTRHISPVIPAVCVVFGVGATGITERIANTRVLGKLSNVDWVQPARVASLLLVGLMLLLVINGAVHGAIKTKQHSIGAAQPVSDLQSEVSPSDSVGTVGLRGYAATVVYTSGEYRPVVLTDTVEDRRRQAELMTVSTPQVTKPSEISGANISYLFVTNRQPEFTDEQRRYVDSAIEQGGTIVHDPPVTSGAFGSVRVIIIRLPDE